MRLSEDVYFVPQFKDRKPKRVKAARAEDKDTPAREDEEEDDFSEQEEQHRPVVEANDPKPQRTLWTALTDFYYRTFPTFLSIVALQSMWVRQR